MFGWIKFRLLLGAIILAVLLILTQLDIIGIWIPLPPPLGRYKMNKLSGHVYDSTNRRVDR